MGYAWIAADHGAQWQPPAGKPLVEPLVLRNQQAGGLLTWVVDVYANTGTGQFALSGGTGGLGATQEGHQADGYCHLVGSEKVVSSTR